MAITDPEGDTITRVYLAPGNNSERFRWDNAAERLSFQTGVYDVDLSGFPTSVLITINAEDDKGETGTSKILITVTDQNDNVPVFGQTIQAFSVTQGVTGLGTLGIITVTDNDLTSPNKDVDLQMVRSVPPSGINYCNVIGNNDGTAEVRFINTNFESAVGGTTVFLTIRATDRGSPQKTSSGTVAVTFITTTTSTTTTTTTTTTTPTTTTTTAAPGFFDVPANVAIFAVLMSILGLLLLGGLFFCFRYCMRGTCTGPGGACDFSDSGNVRQVRPSYNGHEYERFRGSRNNSPQERFRNDRRDANRGQYPERQNSRPPRETREYRDPGQRDPDYRSADYKDEFWKSGDHFEDGRPWSTSLVRLGGMSGQGARPPPAIKPY
ncbi:uncharacterized protein LOC121376791 [Gigantopelta aegis]|uniref:uncharacterized protein LOC121376791 n=1 Tax=Gigantopelta aegis TaxID=1735272 RepID=UPI001B88807D|nr:uncharacterized protein LOC121376791 [Gigantopelta aegis]